MRGFDRAMREYEAREPIHRCKHGVDLYQRDCAACEEVDEPEEEEDELPGSSGEARVIDVDDVLPPVGERGLPFPMR